LSAGAPPQTPLDFRGPTSKGRGRDERGREGEDNVGKGRGGKREGRDGVGRDRGGRGQCWPPKLKLPPRTIFLAPALGAAVR